jgi:uncharacterized protein
LRSIFGEIVAMKKFSNFNIPFEGLILGNHHYDFRIDKAFFDLFEYCEITDGEFDVEVELERKETMLILDFNLSGKVIVQCDRCGSEVTLPIKFEEKIYVKFGEESSDNENILILPMNAHQINIAELLEEFAVLSLPVRKVHKKGKCDKEALKRLEILEQHDSTKIDPRWEKLKGLIKD